MKTICHATILFSLCLSVLPLRAADPTAPEVKAALAKATKYIRSIATEGGYLWRYSEDLKERSGEDKATDTQIWIQPPGTPSMGMAFLRAYEVTKDAQYLDAARAAAYALARGQLESGGWDYLIDFDPQKFGLDYRRTSAGHPPKKYKNISTYDDDNTQSALEFLMDYVAVTKGASGLKEKEIRTALDYGLKKMLEAQYPNGAWPQRYDGKPRNLADFPIKKATIPTDYPREHGKVDYKGFYTLNDNSLADCIGVMLQAYKQFGDAKYLAAAKKGGDFLILAQLPEPQPVWAQQYNRDMEPAWARAFEPPAATGGESSGAIRTLIQLYIETGEKKFLDPIPRAFAWYKRSAIAPNKWARYYELGTNKPIYGDRDGKIYYHLKDISKERQTGYGWESEFGFNKTTRMWDQLQKDGREKLLEKQKPRPMSERNRAKARKDLAAPAARLIEGLDKQGRWLSSDKFEKKVKGLEFGSRIETNVFIKNLRTLCDYLEGLEGRP